MKMRLKLKAVLLFILIALTSARLKRRTKTDKVCTVTQVDPAQNQYTKKVGFYIRPCIENVLNYDANKPTEFKEFVFAVTKVETPLPQTVGTHEIGNVKENFNNDVFKLSTDDIENFNTTPLFAKDIDDPDNKVNTVGVDSENKLDVKGHRNDFIVKDNGNRGVSLQFQAQQPYHFVLNQWVIYWMQLNFMYQDLSKGNRGAKKSYNFYVPTYANALGEYLKDISFDKLSLSSADGILRMLHRIQGKINEEIGVRDRYNVEFERINYKASRLDENNKDLYITNL
jgi:hypothetical protein